MDKEKVLKESITRLLQLGITDKEIIENLGSVGIDKQTARYLLQQTKDELSGKKTDESQSDAGGKTKSGQAQNVVPKGGAQAAKGPSFPDVGQKPQEEEKSEVTIPDDEDIYSKVDEEEEEELKTPVKEKPINNPQYSAVERASDENISELWEKGILATIDVKLTEMQRIRKELDFVLDQKIAEKVALEVKKIETVLESQRTLFYSKIDAHLDAKSDEVRKVVEAKARHMEDLHSRVQEEVRKVQGEKKFNAELLNTINEKLTGLDVVKSQMISETNSSLIGMESKFKDFMSESEQHRDETIQKVDHALQLETRITEGLMQEVKQKIDSLRLAKEDELTARLQAKLKEFDAMAAQVDAKAVSERLSRLKELEQQLLKKQKDLDSQVADISKSLDSQFARDIQALQKYLDNSTNEFRKDFVSFKKEVSKVNSENIVELKKEYSASVDELFAKNLVEWDKKLREKKKEIDDLKGQVDVEKFNATMESLDMFKQQFLNTVKKSISDYNKAKREMSESMIARDKAINDSLQKIDAKMQELSEFEKQFSREVTGLLARMPAGKDGSARAGRKGK